MSREGNNNFEKAAERNSGEGSESIHNKLIEDIYQPQTCFDPPNKYGNRDESRFLDTGKQGNTDTHKLPNLNIVDNSSSIIRDKDPIPPYNPSEHVSNKAPTPRDLPPPQIPTPRDLPPQQIPTPRDLPPQQIPTPRDLPPQRIPTPRDLPPQQIPTPRDLPPPQIPGQKELPAQGSKSRDIELPMQNSSSSLPTLENRQFNGPLNVWRGHRKQEE